MTPEERDELRRLCDEASPGPWEFGFTPRPGRGHRRHWLRSRADIGPANPLASGYWGLSVANQRFIVAARTAVPALLEEVDQLQEERTAFPRDRAYSMLRVLNVVRERYETGETIEELATDYATDVSVIEELVAPYGCDAVRDVLRRVQEELRIATLERDNLLRYGIGRAGVEDFGGGV